MPLPPTPPCVGDLFGWMIVLAVIIVLVVIGVWIAKYALHELRPSTTTTTNRTEKLSFEKTMEELLNEIRLLRKEIEELRREMKE